MSELFLRLLNNAINAGWLILVVLALRLDCSLGWGTAPTRCKFSCPYWPLSGGWVWRQW